MKKDVLDMIEICCNREVTNKIYYYIDRVIVHFDNGQVAKVTTRSYKGV